MGSPCHFEWLSGAKYYDQALGEAALAIELAPLARPIAPTIPAPM